jgi:hypothetical protein
VAAVFEGFVLDAKMNKQNQESIFKNPSKSAPAAAQRVPFASRVGSTAPSRSILSFSAAFGNTIKHQKAGNRMLNQQNKHSRKRAARRQITQKTRRDKEARRDQGTLADCFFSIVRNLWSSLRRNCV